MEPTPNLLILHVSTLLLLLLLSVTVSLFDFFLLTISFLFSKQISCKWSPFDFLFSLLVGRSFQGNGFLLWLGFCQGLIGLLGTESTKAGELP